jgi:DNA topoisomerase-6 subunit B
MTSFQSTLGEDGGIAEELAENQRAISIAEFFEKNKHMLGFDSGARGLVTAVKEAVDNALDATEEAGIAPDIYVEITEVDDYYRLVVEDNGPGITEEQIPRVFGKLLYGSRFHAREQSLTPDQHVMIRRDGDVEFVPIGVLCDAYLPQDDAATARIPDGIEAPSFDRETHEMTWEPVTHAIRHETDERTYEITTEKGRSVEVTGNHSVFGVTKDGETTELKAGDLEAGDAILTPRQLPSTDETVESINLLKHITADRLDGRRVYVYGFDEETLAEIRNGKRVRKQPTPDGSRERYHYRYNGVDIPRDSLESNYLENGYLPAETVLELGWEEKAADCELKAYQVGGEATTVPVGLPVDDALVDTLAYYISEGHAGPRQVGFTFGTHETEPIESAERAVAGVAGSTTAVERERNSSRTKAFGSPLAMFLESVCGDAATNKRVPGFVFEMDPAYQRRFVAALYQGDDSDSRHSNERSHTTTSETLARQLSTLWNMLGVLASTETRENPDGCADGPSTLYRTTVYGEDANLVDAFEATAPGEQGYRRIPVSLLDDVRVDDVTRETVPDTIPGLLMGAGVGSKIEHAETYRSLIEAARDGERVETPRHAHSLRRKGLLDDEGRPTERLGELWETVTNLHGLTETDMCLLPVQAVEETEPPDYVYDISVPGATGRDENFVVANEGALSVKNSRGQQGIGISAAVLYSQLTSGKPAKITSRTQGSADAQYFELVVDTDDNEPEIRNERTTSWDRPHGTRIELEMEANMRARPQLHDYIKHTAVVNPHARVELREPGLDEPLKFERGTDRLPDETEEIRPHPHGVELGTLLKMLAATESYSMSGFLQSEFTRVGDKTATKVCDRFRDHHYGRGMAWTTPTPADGADVESAVVDAVANKSAAATDRFAARVAETVGGRERIAHHELVDIVENLADAVADEFDETFGETVRGNAVDAAWSECTRVDLLVASLYERIDDATSTRKDDATVRGLAERLADKFAEADDRRHRATRDELAAYVDRSADRVEEAVDATFGDTARENVVEACWSVMRTVPDDLPKVKTAADDRDTTSELLAAMRETDILAPPTDCLSPITADLVDAGLRKEFDADFYAAATRDAEVHGGDPFIVEAGVAYGGELDSEGSASVMRFANRVPLVYQRGACAITDVVKRIGWRNYGLDQPGGRGLPSGPAVVMVHVASTNVPFTSESKDAVANVPEIEDEVELAIREAARELKSYLNRRRSLEKRRRKQEVLGRILPEMADKLAAMTDRERPNIDGALGRIMNNVLVERTVEDGAVTLTVRNHSERAEDLDVTDIVDREPTTVSDGASVVDLDDEWFVRWSPSVSAGETARLTYEVGDDEATFDVDVEGVESEKLTVDT